MKHTVIRKDFRRNDDGNVAMLFGLSLFAIVGAIGGAVDIGRAINARIALQEVADYAAMNLATTSANDIRDSTAFKAGAATDSQVQSLAVAQQRAAKLGASSVTLTAAWQNTTDLKVTVTSVYPAIFTAAVPGMPATFNISASATARSNQQLEKAASPSQVNMGYEAWDYNRIYMYCFDKTKKDSSTDNYGRSQEVAIASNGKVNGKAETFTYSPPQCKSGETVSFRLYNVRATSSKINEQTNRTNANKAWNIETAQGGKSTCATVRTVAASCYNWYTDTVRGDDGTDSYNTSPYQLETILCDDGQCKTVTAGSDNASDAGTYITGRETNRPPSKAKGCQAGKYMYFGWEDRPPENGTNGQPLAKGTSDPGGDRDYDDIRVIMNCPQYIAGSREVRMLR